MQLRRNVVKNHYHKIIPQSGGWVSLLIVTTRNFKCGFFSVVSFRRIKIFFLTAKYEAKL